MLEEFINSFAKNIMNNSNINQSTSLVFLAVCIVGGFLYFFWFGYNFVGEKNPEYLNYVSDRLNFSTVRVENTIQWDTLQNRIHYFFVVHNDYKVPDSVRISELKCIGCTSIEKLIYFKEEPTEIYQVTFDMGSFNHIDEIYKLENNNFVSYETMDLSKEEKVRIEKRLRDEILTQIDWDISYLKFK